ncbi:hypothetical protein BH10BAC6_BH10BAC6_14830 [soil metagenome]
MAIVQVKAICMGRFSWNVDQPATISLNQRIGSVTSYGVIMPVWAPNAGLVTFRQPSSVVRAGDILFIIDTSGSAPIV